MYVDQRENFRSYKGFNIHRTNPYGFWIVTGPDNKYLDAFQDSYTMLTLATQAVDLYLEYQAKITDKPVKKVK